MDDDFAGSAIEWSQQSLHGIGNRGRPERTGIQCVEWKQVLHVQNYGARLLPAQPGRCRQQRRRRQPDVDNVRRRTSGRGQQQRPHQVFNASPKSVGQKGRQRRPAPMDANSCGGMVVGDMVGRLRTVDIHGIASGGQIARKLTHKSAAGAALRWEVVGQDGYSQSPPDLSRLAADDTMSGRTFGGFMHHSLTRIVAVLFSAMLAVTCCRKSEPAAKPPPAPTQPTVAPLSEVPDPATDMVHELLSTKEDSGPTDVEVPASDIESLLDDVTTRQRCNTVMGCPSAAALIAFGEEAVAPIVARYQSLGRPNYQKFHLIDLLGQIGSQTAMPFLRDELDAKHWEARTRSALALGHIGARRELARLKSHLAKTVDTEDHAYRYALAYAVETLGGEGGAELVLEGLSAQSIGGRNWGYTKVAVEAAAELQLTGACPLLRPAVEHRDTFLKRAAVAAAGDLSCSDRLLLRAIAAQLHSRVPSVRRQTQATLQKLTGITFTDFEQWQNYDRPDSATPSP